VACRGLRAWALGWSRLHYGAPTNQTYLLGEAGLVDGAEGVRLFSDPPTSSKIPALEPAGFKELARYARPGDRLTVSELFRLCRDLADILALRAWCKQHQVQLRVRPARRASHRHPAWAAGPHQIRFAAHPDQPVTAP
jgi:Resolvase, N terminal domain